MPYSFTQIEKDKSNTIGLVFFFLIFFYVLILAGLSILFQCYFLSLERQAIVISCVVISPVKWGFIILTGAMAALIHYCFAITGLTKRVMSWLRAAPPNVSNEKQQQFQNTLQEVTAATGGRQFNAAVIPDSSLNAFALDDGQSPPVIGITEGALLRLNRAQLKAVVAHEAAHVLNGDCARASIVCAMFEVYTMPVRGLKDVYAGMNHEDRREGYDGGWRRDDSSSTFRAPGQFVLVTMIFVVIIAVFYAVTMFLALLMRMFISREAKLRADATAVRLTRDPLSLAQAIRLLADNWRGAGSPWESLEGVFFVDPLKDPQEEKEGFWGGIFSTHPPFGQRLRVLLEMAHVSQDQLEEEVAPQIIAAQKEQETAALVRRFSIRWMLQKDGVWLGPFTLAQATLLPWINAKTPARREGGQEVICPAGEDEDLKSVAFSRNMAQPDSCPSCKVPLSTLLYEQQTIKKCGSCGGMLLNEDQAGMVMVRRDAALPACVLSMARGMRAGQVDWGVDWQKINSSQRQNGFICPCCQKTMQTRVFNPLYLVVIDKCPACGNMWFEAGEMELLQALYVLKNP